MYTKVFALLVAMAVVAAPAAAIEFQEGTAMELYRFSKGGGQWASKTVCVYSYLGIDTAGHWFETSSECPSPISAIWLDRETGETVRFINLKRGPASRNLEREGDALFLSGGPGETWNVSYTDRWTSRGGQSRKGRFKAKCQASEVKDEHYVVNCRGRIIGDGMTWRREITVSEDTGLWSKSVWKNSRNRQIIWEMLRQPQIR